MFSQIMQEEECGNCAYCRQSEARKAMCRSNNKRLANGEDLYTADVLGLPLTENVTPDHRKMLEALAKSDVEWARVRTSKQASDQASEQQATDQKSAAEHARAFRSLTRYLRRKSEPLLPAPSDAPDEVDRDGYYKRENGKRVFVSDAHSSTSESSTSEAESEHSFDERKERQYLSDEWADTHDSPPH
jgi:hypothetical protein